MVHPSEIKGQGSGAAAEKKTNTGGTAGGAEDNTKGEPSVGENKEQHTTLANFIRSFNRHRTANTN